MNNTLRFITLTLLVAMVGVGGSVVVRSGVQETHAQSRRPLQGWTLKYCGTCYMSRELSNLATDAYRNGATLNPTLKPGEDPRLVEFSKPGENPITGQGDDGVQKIRDKMNELIGDGQQQPGQTGPVDKCAVIDPGWATNKLPHSMWPGVEEYGSCRLPLDILPDCPHFAEVFRYRLGGDINHRLYHNPTGPGTHLTLRSQVLKIIHANVESAQNYVDQISTEIHSINSMLSNHLNFNQNNIKERNERIDTLHNDLMKELKESKLLLVVPNKGQAREYVDSGFRTYTVGQKVSPGIYAVGQNVRESETGQMVRAEKSGDSCTFVKGQTGTGLDNTPGLGNGTGGNGTPGEDGGLLDKLLPLLAGILQGLMGQNQQPQPTPSPTPYEKEDPSPLADNETRELIHTELDRLVESGLPEELREQVAEVIMDIIFRVFYGELSLSRTPVV